MLNHSSFRAKPKRIDLALKCQINNDAEMIYIHLRMQLILSTSAGLLCPPQSSRLHLLIWEGLGYRKCSLTCWGRREFETLNASPASPWHWVLAKVLSQKVFCGTTASFGDEDRVVAAGRGAGRQGQRDWHKEQSSVQKLSILITTPYIEIYTQMEISAKKEIESWRPVCQRSICQNHSIFCSLALPTHETFNL